ncbi:MAG TPA: methyltransferase domain-containing protein [Chloroflexota bacterium]|nr:methyltransferase domain-containing protein [Chloroflexota bacterium]
MIAGSTAGSATAEPAGSTYILGHARHELDRLIEQARLYGDLTEQFLRAAGLARGMRVLDLGCGTGDVSFLAARLVGAEGAVIGVDRAPEAVAVARERAAGAGLGNVRFLTQDASNLALEGPVDALIGRLVLMYFPQPEALLRRLTTIVAPGGLVAFQEMDMGGATSEPECALFAATGERIRQACSHAGVYPRSGLRLRQVFCRAGLPEPTLVHAAPVASGPASAAYDWLAHTVRTFLPLMERSGTATAAEVQVETLAARLRDEAVARDAVLVLPPLVGAWARLDGRRAR